MSHVSIKPNPQVPGSVEPAGWAPPGWQKYRLLPGCVVLEIAIAEVPNSKLLAATTLWQYVDEQAIPIEVRKRLDHNGFRAGIVGNQLPQALLELLTPDVPDAESKLDQVAAELLAHRRLFVEHQLEQLQPGEQHWVACSPQIEQFLWQVGDGSSQRTGVVENARCGFILSFKPRSEGGIDLQILPELRHGEMRPRYGVVGNQILFQDQLESVKFTELRVSGWLRAGQTLILAPSRAEDLLAEHFLHVDTPAQSNRRFLLVRLLQTQEDDLFAPDHARRPLAND